MLHIARGLSLPIEAVTQTFAILAMQGVGKTYTASVLAEEFSKASLPYAVLDPTGAWYGLRASADGKGPGYPVTILGGDHGDVPLEEAAGKVIAALLADETPQLVLDLSLFTKAAMRRFVADFAEELYRKNRLPLHLIMDEADAFCPQKPRPDEMRMLGAIDEIVRRGRIHGLGCTLVTQRSAVLNKDVLTQMEVLIALRTAHPRDRAPVLEWMKVHATSEQLAQVTETLATLPKGDAWIMSAGWLDLFKRIHVRERETFNSSATPEPGQRKIEPKKLADVDLKVLRERMAATIERAKAEDPRELRRQIAALKAELAKKSGAAVDPQALQKAREEGRAEGFAEAQKTAQARATFIRTSVKAAQEAISRALATDEVVTVPFIRAAPASPVSQHPRSVTQHHSREYAMLKITKGGLLALGFYDPLPAPGPDLLQRRQSMDRANFIIEQDIPGTPLVIRDVGPWDKFMTVTNAAESVVAEIYRGDRISDGRRLFYIDSDGQMDELLHDHGVFKRFAPGPRERREA